MMRIEFNPRLLEESVFLALHISARSPLPLREGVGGGTEAARFHRLADSLYKMSMGDERERCFQNLYRETFERLNLDRPVIEAVAFFPTLNAKLERFVFPFAERRKDEESELFAGENACYTAMLPLRPETLSDAEAFRRVAFHELTHIEDMLNPDFAGANPRSVAELAKNQLEAIRDRYRELWDITIDARLMAKQRPAQHSDEWHARQFLKVFGSSPEFEALFTNLWTCPFASVPSNELLIEAASEPGKLARWLERRELSACAVAG